MIESALLLKVIEILTPVILSIGGGYIYVLKQRAENEKIKLDLDVLHAKEREKQNGIPWQDQMRKDHKKRKDVEKEKSNKLHSV